MSDGIKQLAKNLQNMGRGRDTILAHIMPEEAAMLKRMGGRGSVNPKTGLLEFEAWGAAGAADAYGGSWGGSSSSGSANPGDIAGGGFGSGNIGGGSSTGGSSWSGGGRDSSSSNQSPSYSTGGDGFNSANWGVGGGRLTPSNPSVSSSDGGAWTPTGGGGGGFGVPTIVSNAASSVGQMLAPIGQSLLNFSDTSTALLSDIYNNPSNYVPSFGSTSSAGYYEDIPSAVGDLPGTMDAFGRVMNPRTIPVPGYTTYANAVGDINFLSQGPQEPTRVWNENPITVPNAPTSTTNAYNFVPNYTGLPQEEAALQARIQNTRLMEDLNRAFPVGPQPKQLSSFPAVPDARELYGVEEPAGIASIRPTTSMLADRLPNAPAVGEGPAPLGSSLEELMGTAPVGNPLYAGFDITTRTVPNTATVDVAKAYEAYNPILARPDQVYSGLISKLTGVDPVTGNPVIDPATGQPVKSSGTWTPGSVINSETGLPVSGVATWSTPAFETPEEKAAYDAALKQYQPAMRLTPQYEATQATTNFARSGGGTPTDVSGGVAPQGFADVFGPQAEVGAAVTNTLDTYFNELSQAQTSQTGQTPRPSVIPSAPAPVTAGGVPLYAEATPFSGPKGALPMTDAARYAGGGVFSDIEELNNLPSGYLGKLYGIESGFGRNLTTPLSSASGPFQFTKATARQYGLMGQGFDDRMDLLQSAAATGSLAADNARVLEKALGRPPSAGELYLAHQQGAGGAVSLLRNPNESAYNALKRAYGGDEDMAMQALINNRGSLSMSAAQFARMWTNKMDRAPVAPTGGYNTQFASAPSVTPAQVAQQPELVSNVLDEDFMRVVNQIGNPDLSAETAAAVSQNVFEGQESTPTVTGGGDGGYADRYTPRTRTAKANESVTPPAPVTPPATTGMDLTRRAYVPRDFAVTTSPAYS